MVSVTKNRLGLGTGGVFTSVTVTTTPTRLPNNLVGRTLVQIYNESNTFVRTVQNSGGTVGTKILKDQREIIECSDTFAPDDNGDLSVKSLYLKTDSGTATVIVGEYY